MTKATNRPEIDSRTLFLENVAIALVPPLSWVATCSRILDVMTSKRFQFSPDQREWNRAVARLVGTSLVSQGLIAVLFLQKVFLVTQPLPHILLFTAFALSMFNIADTLSVLDS